MAISERSRHQLAQANQGSGGLYPEQKPDRTKRVLNYPGLEYLWEKLKKSDMGGGTALSDPEVAEILGDWNPGELGPDGNARAADKLSTPRQIGIASPSGAVTGHVRFDGTEDVTIEVDHNYLSNMEIQSMLNEQGLTL